jgi:plastocyanin
VALPTIIVVIASAPQRPTRAGDKPAASVPVQGTVTYAGPIPRPIAIPEAGTVRHVIEVDGKTKGVRHAAVWLEGSSLKPANGASVKGTNLKSAPAVQVDQRDYQFVPPVLSVQAGQEVEFLNSDPCNHGVMAASVEQANAFNVLTPASGSYKHRFKVSKRPIALTCPLHGSMAGWVFVFDHPWHAVTDKAGKFRLPPAPPGEYMLVVQHPDGGLRRQQKVRVQASESVRVQVELGEAKAGQDGKNKAAGPADR